jgi:geranylgeranyl diphosphate synthase type II
MEGYTKETMKALSDRIAENSRATEESLRGYFQIEDGDLGEILDAETYSLLGGGKRIRPFLVNEICRMLGGTREASMPFAAALEMIHTYSLIHDDLPCMDNDDLRRGKPTNHKVYGYATALLAGDALLTRAFGVAASNPCASAEARAAAVHTLSRKAGDLGMIGGQIIDLRGENERLSFETLLRLHSLKTGALMECAALLGAYAAGFDANSAEAAAVTTYASKIGLAFQVIDDILDQTASEGELGKPIGSDASRGKTTFLTYFSLEDAKCYAEKLTKEAVEAIEILPNSETLSALAVYLLERTY